MPVTEKRLSLSSPGKINLYFELLGKREDGFHEIETVMAPVSICDQLEFRLTDQPDLRLELSGKKQGIPTDERNLILTTLQRVQQLAVQEGKGPLPGLKIRLTKNIPVAAGMGGASSNAATSIIAANELWGLGWPMSKQVELAASIGSDVPFFLSRQLAHCTGRGEKIRPIPCNFRLPVLIAQPPVGLSTAEVYARCQVPESPQSSLSFLEALHSGQPKSIGNLMFNRLEPFAAGMTGWIERFRYEFSRTHPVGQQMTGSGSCYFGIYPNRKVARKAAGCLSNRLGDVTILLGQTLNCGGVSGF
ncbi:MAG: 4-(cytidine 5'-diphospho)-2-C-methyl-D-erythritol kinase [Mariniblastus sp.]|nr:4-(cytidine 5'-diphospho)-2-C-methyl-D-erythritol kinase [Mariniblastus sp.]